MADIRVPKVGMSTVEVEITDILVEVGQQVAATDILLVVAADKVDLEVEAGVTGTVTEILVSEGDESEVGEIIARIEES